MIPHYEQLSKLTLCRYFFNKMIVCSKGSEVYFQHFPSIFLNLASLIFGTGAALHNKFKRWQEYLLYGDKAVANGIVKFSSS